MKKIFSILGMLSFTAMSYAQVGIHTDAPNATLDVRESNVFSASVPQGVSFPNFTTEERATFVGVQKGTMIYNTTKRCLELYGVNNGVTDWYCICDTCEVASVEEEITEDDEVIIRLNSIYRIVDIEDRFRFFSSFINGQLSPMFRNGQILEENDGDGGMSYEAQEDGRYTEKRYPITLYGFTNITMNDASFDGRYYNVYRSMETINANIVIPAGRVTKGTGIIPVYLELPSGINTIHTADGLMQTITVGGQIANIVYEAENEE